MSYRDDACDVRTLAYLPSGRSLYLISFEVNAERILTGRQRSAFRPDIPKGTTVRFEPGDENRRPCRHRGGGRGAFNNLTDAGPDNPEVKRRAVTRDSSRLIQGSHHMAGAGRDVNMLSCMADDGDRVRSRGHVALGGGRAGSVCSG